MCDHHKSDYGSNKTNVILSVQTPPTSLQLISQWADGCDVRVLVHLYESSCWVSSLLEVFLSVLLLNLQSKPRTQDPLRTDTWTGDRRQGELGGAGGSDSVSGELSYSQQAERRTKLRSEWKLLPEDVRSRWWGTCLHNRWLSRWSETEMDQSVT